MNLHTSLSPQNDHTLKTINAIQITYHNDHARKLLRTLISLPYIHNLPFIRDDISLRNKYIILL